MAVLGVSKVIPDEKMFDISSTEMVNEKYNLSELSPDDATKQQLTELFARGLPPAVTLSFKDGSTYNFNLQSPKAKHYIEINGKISQAVFSFFLNIPKMPLPRQILYGPLFEKPKFSDLITGNPLKFEEDQVRMLKASLYNDSLDNPLHCGGWGGRMSEEEQKKFVHEILTLHPEYLDQKDLHEETPLMSFASRSSRLSQSWWPQVRILLEAGADPYSTDKWGISCLHTMLSHLSGIKERLGDPGDPEEQNPAYSELEPLIKALKESLKKEPPKTSSWLTLSYREKILNSSIEQIKGLIKNDLL